MAKLIIKLTKSKSKLTFDRSLRSGETPRLLCNSQKAKKILKWKTNVSMNEGLQQTIEFFKERPQMISNLPYML